MSVSLQAERAVFAANELRRYQSIERRSWRPWRRIKTTRDRLLLELALPRATGAAEDFLLMRATAVLKPELFESIAPDAADPNTTRLRKAARDMVKLKTIWRVDLAYDVEQAAAWPEFWNWRDLRHVLVHRLGQWRPGIDPKPDLASRIAVLGQDPDLYRGLIPLAPDDLRDAIANAIALVLEADAGTAP